MLTNSEQAGMIEWDVYVLGKWIGTVREREVTDRGRDRDSDARCTALVAYDIPDDAEFSVSPR